MTFPSWRECSAFAIETFTDISARGGVTIHTIYGDADQPSHSVRLWVWNEED